MVTLKRPRVTFVIILFLKENIQYFLKHIIRTYSIEEIHRGVELHHINSASHDVFDVLTLVKQERLAAFTESFTQNLMFNIGSGFTLAIQTIVMKPEFLLAIV